MIGNKKNKNKKSRRNNKFLNFKFPKVNISEKIKEIKAPGMPKFPEVKVSEKIKEIKIPEMPKLSEMIDIKKIPGGFKIIGCVALALVVLAIVLICKSCAGNPQTAQVVNESYVSEKESEQESLEEAAMAESKAAADAAAAESRAAAEEKSRHAAIENEISSYGNLGIVNCDTYTFVRKEPNTTSERLGKIFAGGACSILDEADSEWVHVKSGGIDGYMKKEFLYTGDEAKEKAMENMAERAIVLKDDVLIREDSTINSVSIGKVYQGERYLIKDKIDDWIKISHDETTGFINAEYAEIKECLDEARYLKNDRDKETALNMYTNIGITNFESGVLNIRSKPSTSSKIVGMMSPNCTVQIEDVTDDGEWLYIKSGSVEGYVKAEYVSTGGDATTKVLQKVELMAISETDGLNVRSGPGKEYKVISSIAANERYPVVSETFNEDFTEQWVQINLGDTDDNGEELSAYVSKDYVTVRYAANEAVKYSEDEIMAANSDSRRSSIVQYALQFVGNRYVWGGTSLTNGCDCSGFTRGVMANFGISLPHSSRAQANMGTKINSSQMRPGDLIFYANSSGTINHVTIYIGGGRIVGAQNRKTGIKTAAWNYRTPVKIVNILGD